VEFLDDHAAVEARRLRRRTVIGCLIAVAGTAAIFGLVRLAPAASPLIGLADSLFLTLVIACAWYGGLMPGLLATVSGTSAFALLFSGGNHELAPSIDLPTQVGALATLGLLVSVLAGGLHENRRQIASSHRQILEEGERNRQVLRALQEKAAQENAGRKTAEEQLRRIGWMLESRPRNEPQTQPYGDMAQLNTRRTLADAVSPDLVQDAVRDYLDLLETSATVYERNGDYVHRSFSSEWCRFLDAASRRLIPTEDNRVAARSGQWHCHESCWEASRKAMETGKPVDMECKGGIRLHAVPIRAGSVPVGSMGFGYGDPPTDPDQLSKVAELYAVSVEDLAERARQYSSRPPFIITQAKERARAAARLLGEIVQRRRLEQELQFRLRELAEADRRKDMFLATLAHELRNPLAPMRNALQVVKLAEGDPVRITVAREIMERQVTQMVRLVDDLLDVSRITRNKLELRKAVVDLGAILEQAVEISRPVIDAAKHKLRVELPREPILVEADSVKLAQVFLNLLNNAAKYMEPGGEIVLTASLQNDKAVVSVRDQGIGIAPEMLARVFDAFYQVDQLSSRTQGGLGVGLMLAQRLVNLHGGAVTARSEGVGKGAEFVVTLPAIVPAENPGNPSVSDVTSPGSLEGLETPMRHHRVVIVDDNEDSASSLATLLGLEGHDVRVAYDGVRALEIARLMQPNVIVCDIGLPGMSGYEVARIVRREPWGRSATLIAVTGWGQEDDRRRSSEAGFDHHLVKPVEPDQLVALLAHVRSSEWIPDGSSARSLA
jgi:signal transduction histidine kinase/ActR/RegA family two-component response regulator